jgi:hypothetical protein
MRGANTGSNGPIKQNKTQLVVIQERSLRFYP